jgi:hypothetical protein
VHGILIYCADYHCSRSIAMSGDVWPDDVRLSDIEPRFVCRAYGKRGHRAYFPKPSDISALLDIAESLIETIYVHPHQAKGQKIPPRKPKGKPQQG